MNLKTKRTAVKFFFLVLTFGTLQAQTHVPVENSTFWEVSGNGLSKPSYLFGTFHLMGKVYVDSLTAVTKRFQESEVVVGELLFDSTVNMKVMKAAQLNGTTLDKLLTPEAYNQTAAWLKELSGYDLRMLNGLNPITIQVLLMATMQQKYYPMDPQRDVVMDMYFQQHAKKNGKKVIGLETVEQQVEALYGQFSYERQAELLTEYVANKEKARQEMVTMNRYYRQGNLTELEKLMSSQTYDAGEAAVLLDNRNKNWVTVLPDLFKQHSTFVAVGALHLSGKNGLVTLLRQQGYTVKPLAKQ